MTTPKVSVCCAWYNRADYITDTLDSLLSQQGVDFEIIVVNDGSTDPAVAETLDAIRDPRLTVIHQDNTGFTAAIKKAVGTARGDYIAIQGAGDASLPGRLAAQSDALDRHPDCAAASCGRREIIIGGLQDGLAKILTPPAGIFGRTADERARLERHNPFSHGEMMFRRTAYDAVGGYRTVFAFSQDSDLWLRMIERAPFYNCTETLYERRLFTQDGISMNVAKTAAQVTLSVLSRECYRQRLSCGQDIVDIFGEHAVLFRKRSRKVAHHRAAAALKYLYAGQMEQARLYADLALTEKLTFVSVATALLTATLNLFPAGLRPYRKMIDKFKPIRDFRPYDHDLSP